MSGLNIIHPPKNFTSKCWQVFTPLLEGWQGSTASDKFIPDHRPICFWGLGWDNRIYAGRCIDEKRRWLFADMPYFNRWMGEHTADSCHWRLIPNGIHEHTIGDYPGDRADSLGIELRDWRKDGKHILIAPSSDTVTRFILEKDVSDKQWTRETVEILKDLTDRPIKIRNKPRKGKLSGPMVEITSLEADLRDCWAVVTTCSIVGIQAAIAGIPVFCHPRAPSAAVGNFALSRIERPEMPDRRQWLNTLTYRQFTKAEMRSGLAREILHQLL